MKKIQKVIEKNSFENGERYEFMNYPEYDSETSLKIFNNILLNNVKTTSLQRKIIYDDGSEYILPITEIITVLNDRTGFIVIYDKKPSIFSSESTYPWFFEPPNNAAIYNADGSLRFQLIIPNNIYNEHFYLLQGSSIAYPDFPCVILQSDKNPNTSGFYSLYAIEPHNPELIYTGASIKF